MVSILKNLLTMSLSGSIVILLVLALRLVLKKAPARLMCLLWLLAGLRLVLPFHIESDFSLQPDTQQLLKPVVSDRVSAPQEYVPQDMIPAMPTIGENITVNTDVGVSTTVQRSIDWMAVAAYVWAVGAAAMLIYTVISYVRLKRQVRDAVATTGGAWECGSLNGPFLLGYLKPRIFLPTGLSGEDREYVLSHERTHLAWGDHWTKLAGFLCLSVHWFNPLVWFAYWCLCKDLETACDEQVVRGYDVERRKAYSKALLACSAGSRPVSACPVAFGEVNVKERIMRVLNYRKPTFWICLVCVIAIICAAVFFLTDPLKEMTMEDYVALIGTERSELLSKLGLEEGEVTYSETTWRYCLPNTVQHNGREYQVYCDAGEAVRNRAISFQFISKPDPNEQMSIDGFAQEYMAFQGLYCQQYGQPEPISLYTDSQQILDAFDERSRFDTSVFSVATTWVVSEDIPYSGLRAFLEDFVTWDEVTYLGQWYGAQMQGTLRVHLQGNYANGVVVYQITYSASTMPVWEDKVKYDMIFEEYASRIGKYNEDFFDGLDVNEDNIHYSDFGALMMESIECEDLLWSVSTYSREFAENRVTSLMFLADRMRFDEMAENYLHMQELLKGIYGEPTKVSDEFSNVEQMRQSLDNYSGDTVWRPHTKWQFTQVREMYPSVQKFLDDLPEMQLMKEWFHKAYGADAIPQYYLEVTLICDAGEGETNQILISYGVGVNPIYP